MPSSPRRSVGFPNDLPTSASCLPARLGVRHACGRQPARQPARAGEVEVHYRGNTCIGYIAARRIRRILGSRAGLKGPVVLVPRGATVWLEVTAPKGPLFGKKKTRLSKNG